MMDKNIEAKTALVRRLAGLGVVLGALVVASGCGRNAESGTDSSTHWLQPCANDTECGRLSCLHGVCTKACQAASECASLAPAALCQSLPSSSSAPAAGSVCTVSCTTSSECRSIASDLICTGGNCQPEPNAGQGGATGAGTGAQAGTNQAAAQAGSSVAGGTRATGGAPGSSGAGTATTAGNMTAQGGDRAGSGGSGSVGTGGAFPDSQGRGGDANSGGSGGSGGSSGVGGGLSGAGGGLSPGDRLVLDPATLTFFNLPIDSVRNAISGYDAAHRTCATVVWEWSMLGARCNDATTWSNPYVVLVTDTQPPCSEWAYGGNVETLGWTGCVDFAFGSASMDMVDVEVTVQGTSFNGTIVAKKRPAGSVTFGLEYSSDLPESVYVQTSNDLGLPTWLRVSKDGQTLRIFDDCSTPKCGSNDGVCGVALHQARSITRGTTSGGVYGTIYATWDGRVRSLDVTTTGQCIVDAPATPGTYQVEVCYGHSTVDGAGNDVENPICVVRDFTYPNERVVVTVDDSG